MDVNPLEIDEAPDAAKPWLEGAAKAWVGSCRTSTKRWQMPL